MAYGILLLRIVVGLTLAAHGAQKLFGWFGGGGLRGTAGSFGSMRFRAPGAMALAGGLSEVAGGAVALGLAMASVMVVAVGSVHLKNGFFIGKGGFEYNLTIWTVAVAVAAAGPGRFSLHRAFGVDGNTSGAWVG